ncbi:MAG: GAF domain-containing protein [Planctomycetes bacterium]|nr:GAF domain-containing protein [Planctomycetota bacterium]
MKKAPAQISQLSEAVKALLAGQGEPRQKLQAALDAVAGAFGALTATLHAIGPEPRFLYLVAQRGLPEKLLASTKKIAFGKGMAGLCAARREPVTVCNLQTDASGVARPAARETGVAGSIVIPIFGDRGEPVLGTLGIGKPGEHAFSAEEKKALEACARELAAALKGLDHG